MSKKNNVQVVFCIIGVALLAYIAYDFNRKEQRIRELEEELNSSNLISEKIKKQLLGLLDKHPNIDADVKQELNQVAILIGIQQETKAILCMTKIIENLFKKLLENDNDFNKDLKLRTRRKAAFADYLEYAKKSSIISPEDYHLISVLKQIRNEEAHELNVVKEKSRLMGCFISGLGITITLYNMVKSKIIANESSQIE